MTFFFKTNTIRVILKNVLALPSFKRAVNGRFCFEVHLVHLFFEVHQMHLSITNKLHNAPGG